MAAGSTPGRREALQSALAASILSIPLTYAAARAAQALLYPEPDPALVVWSMRIAMYWRLALGAYVAAMLAPIAYAAARRFPEATARLLPRLAALALGAIALQALVAP